MNEQQQTLGVIRGLRKKNDKSQDQQNCQHNPDHNCHFDPVNGRLALHLARLPIDHELVEFRRIIIVGQENWKQDMLESGLGKLGANIQIALGIAGHLPGTLLALFATNEFLAFLPDFGQAKFAGR